MNEEQFKQALQELHDKNQRTQYSPDQLEDIQYQFSYILQSYLWEGNAIKTLNNSHYWSLAKSWHPDKLTPDSSQDPFVSWYIRLNGKDQNSLFKVLGNIKEAYRPELRFRIREANDESFHFFGEFAKHLPLVYNVFWPIFYALEALERNIDNYTPKYRMWAKSLYYGSTLLPFILLGFMFKLEGRALDLFINLITSQSAWLGGVLDSGMIGLPLVCISVYIGLYFEKKFKKIDFSDDLLSVLFYQIPMMPVFETFEIFKKDIENKSSFKTKLLAFSQLCIFSLLALAQIASSAYGIYLASPLLGIFASFPLSGLALANIPLILSQIYHEPKNSLFLIGEYFFTIANRYHSLAKNSISYILDMTKHYLPKFFTPSHKEPEDVVKPVFIPVEKDAKATAVVEPVSASVPYWKTKFDKYMSKDNHNITIKRRSLKKQRNEILNAMNIGEDHPFREKLDDLITQKSADYDASGFVQDNASDKQYPIFETLNLKTQVLFLNNALNKKAHLPLGQFVDKYPQDLDYHKLMVKNTLG